jgi:hypothetical protein
MFTTVKTTMKHLSASTLIRRIVITLILVCLAQTATVTNPVAAHSEPPVNLVTAPALLVDPAQRFTVPSVFRRSTLSTSLVQVKFQSGGLYVRARFTANNLRGSSIRMSLFLGWGNGTWMEPNPNAPSDYISPGGYLTQQFVGTADYANTEWNSVEFYIPWEYFPRVTQNTSVFLVAYVGLDGQEYTTSSYRQYFILLAPTE